MQDQSLKNYTKFLLLTLTLFITASCGSSGNGTGTLSIGLTDGVNENYEAVYVTINDVQVHRKGESEDSENGWLSLPDYQGPQTINLLDLRDGVISGLGSINLEAGAYTQVRLIIGTTPDAQSNIQCHPHPFANYVIDGDGNPLEMKVPSGEQTGIKIVCAGKCDISDNQTTELILDFDAEQSVVVAGNSGNINLKPTIKVLATEDFALVTGQIVESPAGTSGPLAGAHLSAQIYDPSTADLKDEVRIVSATTANSEGEFRLLLKPGEYNLVATQSGYSPQAIDFIAIAGEVSDHLIELTVSPSGSVSGNFTISGIVEPTFGSLDFRQDVSLPGEVIEVDSVEVLSGNSYNVNLPTIPTTDYQVVASTCEQTTQDIDVIIAEDTILNLNIIFP